ncbi:MAG: substrate-binding domain-containing protein [Clostridia bacterium]|nr:substrate-binding domain-containing protein [Clostridia bacterium]
MKQKKQSVYSKIADDLLSKIKSDLYPIGSKLPPERELMEIYKVERTTVRRGLELLRQGGYINKAAGLGSLVVSKEAIDIDSNVQKQGAISEKANNHTLSSLSDTHILALLPSSRHPDSALATALLENLSCVCKKENVLLTTLSDYDKQQVEKLLESSSFNACVVFCGTTDEILDLLNNHILRICFALCKINGYRCILPDISGACEMAAEYLTNNGHKNIAFIGSEKGSSLQVQYRERFIQEVLRRNPECNINQYTNIGGCDEKSGFDRLSELIRRAGGNFSAVATINSDVAAGAIKAAKYYRLSVPEELSVISLSGHDKMCQADTFNTNLNQLAYEILNSCAYNFDSSYGTVICCGFDFISGKTTTAAKAEKASGRRLSDFLL